jgi:NAD(P)-dependent dehydrogenase (short-subunit alcohol dehydrogenase family)
LQLQGRHPLHPGTTTLAAALAERDRLFVQHMTSSASAWDPATLRTTVPAALGDGPQTFNDSALTALFDVGLNALAHRIAPQAGYGDGSTVINAITPSAANTRILEQVAPEHIKYMLAKIPRGRFVEVDEVAAMIAFMVSEECSFTTGAVFDISGGRATY